MIVQLNLVRRGRQQSQAGQAFWLSRRQLGSGVKFVDKY
jgi:hypothetical protein